MLLLVGLVAGIVWSYAKNRVLFFCGILFLLSFVLTSNWVRPIGTIMAERLMYFPAVGFDAAVAFLLAEGLNRTRWKSLAFVLTASLIAGYGLRSVCRNLDWRDHMALFGSAARTSPDSGLVQSNYAVVLLHDANDPAGAALHARRAIEIQPDAVAAYFTLGRANRRLGKPEEAAEAFSKVAELAPRTTGGVAALRDLAEIQESRGRWGDARAAYEKLVEWRPSDASALVSLARLCDRMGETDRARSLLDRASRVPAKP
jgi:tetratricopeptide (TPR) repeat protein